MPKSSADPLNWEEPLPAAKGRTPHELVMEFAPTMSSSKLAEMLARYGFVVSPRTVRDHSPKRGFKPGSTQRPKAAADPGPSETHDRQENAWTVELRGTRIHTLDQMVRYCKVDLREWKVERFVVNKWEIGRAARRVNMKWSKGRASGSVRDTGKIHVEPLWQVKVWLARKVDELAVRNELEALKRLARRQARAPKRTYPRPVAADHLLEVSIPDAHNGRLALQDETGWDNYDLDISKQIFQSALQALVARASAFKFAGVCFVVGNDAMNFDNLLGTTTAGTPQSNAGPYRRVFSVTRDLLVWGVEQLRPLAPVKVVVVSGNHDALGAWHLGDSLASYFHKHRDVEVDFSAPPRKYHRFGSVLLMWTHGDKGKKENYPLIMATEQPEMFGATRFREVHLGHFHRVQAEEFNGVRVRTLPSLTAPDNWTADMGLVGTIRSAEAYVWHRRDGLAATLYYAVPEKFARRQ